MCIYCEVSNAVLTRYSKCVIVYCRVSGKFRQFSKEDARHAEENSTEELQQPSGPEVRAVPADDLRRAALVALSGTRENTSIFTEKSRHVT